MPLALVTKRTLVGTMVLFILLSTVSAQTHHWRGMQKQSLITFDWNCSRQELFTTPSLQKVVARSMSQEGRAGPGMYGDRAFVINLHKSGPPVYFVPTACGATGNCYWRLYHINPLRFAGEISGQFIYTYRASHGMPTIITYGNYSAMDGVLFTYVWTRRGYKRMGGNYYVNFGPPDARPRPTFLDSASRQCKDYGS